jgi:hypothetical protein
MGRGPRRRAGTSRRQRARAGASRGADCGCRHGASPTGAGRFGYRTGRRRSGARRRWSARRPARRAGTCCGPRRRCGRGARRSRGRDRYGIGRRSGRRRCRGDRARGCRSGDRHRGSGRTRWCSGWRRCGRCGYDVGGRYQPITVLVDVRAGGGWVEQGIDDGRNPLATGNAACRIDSRRAERSHCEHRQGDGGSTPPYRPSAPLPAAAHTVQGDAAPAPGAAGSRPTRAPQHVTPRPPVTVG